MTDSPYLPGTRVQYAWDSTTLGEFKTCPRLYQLSRLEGWTTKEESVHLRFGSLYQKALENYDIERAQGINHEDALIDVVRELLITSWDFDSDHKTKTRANLIRSVIWYLDDHRDDPAKTHILSNGKPAVELSFKFELEWGPETGKQIEWKANSIGIPEEHVVASQPYLLCGHLDKVVEYSGDLYALDNKTVWRFWGMEWEPDNQMTLYSLASKIVLGAPVRGVIIDMAMNTENKTEFKRTITHRTEDQLVEWIEDLHHWFSLAEQYAIANYWPMNDTSCGKYGGCRFRDICSKSPGVREMFLRSNFVQKPEEERWNPLRPR